jgi:TM2 domain-containing membrane protein YozV
MLFFTISVSGQDRTDQPATDTLTKDKKHSPGKAALMSAVLPGLGQIYNKKYWKLPIVYAGFGTLTYFIITNANNYLTYQCAYIEELNGATNGNYADLTARYTETELLSGSEYYRRNLEVTILLSAVWYTLTIVDAAVDAHLMTFDVGEDLSLEISPALIPPVQSYKPAAGIGLTLRFKNR